MHSVHVSWVTGLLHKVAMDADALYAGVHGDSG